MPDDLKALLEAYNSNSLTLMASFHGLAKKGPNSKADSVAGLERVLVDPQRIAQNWRELAAAERFVMEELLRLGAQANSRQLQRAAEKAGLVDPALRSQYPVDADPRQENSRRLENILARLNLRGLLFQAEDQLLPGHYSPNATPPKRDLRRLVGKVCVPPAVLRHLPAPPPAPSVVSQAPAPVSATRAGSARTFQRDLYLYWSFVRETPFRLTLKGQPPKPALKTLAAQLLERVELAKNEDELDHPRLRFLRLLLEELGLLTVSPERDLRVTGDSDFFSLAPAERVRRSFEAWRAGGFFIEFSLLPANVRPARDEPIPHSAANPALAHARRTVLAMLAELAPDGWRSLPDLVEAVRDQDLEFLLPHSAAEALPYYQNASAYDAEANPFGLQFRVGYNSKENDNWSLVEGSFIRAVVTGPLHWLGLIDFGWPGDATGPAQAYRLAEMGRWVLGLGPVPAIQAEGGRVIVQPNLHIIALDPVADATLVQLDHFAERLSAERAVEYRLTRASVYRGQQSGWEVPPIKDFLRAHTRADLPGNVERTLDEWQAQHERVILRSGFSLAHGPAALFDTLLADPASRPLLADRPAPEVATLAGPLAAFIEAAGRQGLLPLVNQRADAARDSLSVDEAGRVTFLAARPSLYLHGHLAAFADPAGDGAYQISAASVARAARAGLGAPQVLERLQQMHSGPLPAGLARRVRAWAHHYGDGALEEVLLLQMGSAGTLQELLADPELAPLLKPFAPPDRKALARVKRKDVAALRAALAERGISLKNSLE